jgi:uncharacterized membrane protein YozB (DUF420 family)
MSVLALCSTAALVFVAAGLLLRRRRPEWHLKLMMAAFAIDLGLVVYIEATRRAVEKVAFEGHALLWFHAAVSVGVVVCYAAMIGLGRRLLVGEATVRHLHRNLGVLFCVLRLLNYVTSFLV